MEMKVSGGKSLAVLRPSMDASFAGGSPYAGFFKVRCFMVSVVPCFTFPRVTTLRPKIKRMFAISPASWSLSGRSARAAGHAGGQAVGLAGIARCQRVAEDTAALDPRTKWVLVDLIQRLAAAGRTLIVATHELDVVPLISDRVIVLSEGGRIVGDGTPDEILGDRDLLVAANLIHEHLHEHGVVAHSHPHDPEDGHHPA